MHKKILFFKLIFSLLLLVSCQTNEKLNFNIQDSRNNDQNIKKVQKTKWQSLADQGILNLKENKLEQASKLFNTALKLNINNSYLQFLNGYTYHLIAFKKNSTHYKLAEQGYKLAIKFDESNWLARYHLGLLYLDQKQFNNAKIAFADALLYEDSDKNLLQNFIYASYFAKDPISASGASNRLCDLEGLSERCLKNQIILNASLNDRDKINKYFSIYKENFTKKNDFNLLKKRMASWALFYKEVKKNNKFIKKIQATTEEESIEEESTEEESTEEESTQDIIKEEKNEKSIVDDTDYNKMLVTDVVIINSIENAQTSSGVNLLNGLTLQFGNTTNSLDAYFSGNINQSYVDADSDGVLDSAATQDRFVQAITIPAITYSLNIANANSTRNEILARPSLVAYEGKESQFFSGNIIQAGAVGSGDDSEISIEDDIGITLKITPEIVTNDIVKLNVEAERTFLVTPSSSVNFTYQINRSKTSVKSTVTMRRGDTLILSGLSEKETENVRDGVPFLQDIPGVQYFFSKKTTKDVNKSVLILITPRMPEYTYLSRESRKKIAEISDLTEQEVLNQLKGRYSDWFKPYPNWTSTFRHLQNNSLYREFRTGDVSLERWDTMMNRNNRLNQALEFLYY